MSNRFRYFQGGELRFPDVMSFMRELQAQGFENEFDNGLVMRRLWKALDELRAEHSLTVSSDYFILTTVGSSNLHGDLLVVLLCDGSNEKATRVVELFMRGDSLTVMSNVLVEKVVVDDKPVPATPTIQSVLKPVMKSYSWDGAQQAIKANKRFNPTGVKAFKAVAAAIMADAAEMTHRIQLTDKANGVLANFVVGGKSIQQVFFQYNQ